MQGCCRLVLANIHAEVPNIEANKEKILRASKIFKERGANVAIFPEFCLSGYFWEDEQACWAYMNEAVTENHRDWIDGTLKPLLDDEFETDYYEQHYPRASTQVLQHDLFLSLGWILTT